MTTLKRFWLHIVVIIGAGFAALIVFVSPGTAPTSVPTPRPSEVATAVPTPSPIRTEAPRASASPMHTEAPRATASPTSSASPAPSLSGIAVTAFGGYQGSTYTQHQGGDIFEYSERPTVTFNGNVQALNDFAYTITGSDGSTPPSSIYWVGYGKSAQFTVRQIPGVVYTLKITAPVVWSATFTTAPVALPTPVASKSTKPDPHYVYGVLEHPFPYSLSGATAAQQIQLLCNAGVGFVRIDYAAQGILTDGTGKVLLSTPNFVTEDSILAKLHACGITELPIILQYADGPLLAGGTGYPHAFQWPTATNGTPGYADFAKAVVAHLQRVAPWVTRVELFNEPNLHGWNFFPVGGNVKTLDTSGATQAVYMKDAYAAIKSVDPGMMVVGPALADGGQDTDPRKFLTTMYANGCKTGVCWDVLSVHNYDWENPTFYKSPSYQNQWGIYKQLQKIAVQHGDPTPHVMLTEWGYSTLTTSPLGFDPSVQARYEALGYNLMLTDPTVDGIVYVNVYNPGTDFWGRTSLTDTSYNPLPGYQLLRQFAQF